MEGYLELIKEQHKEYDELKQKYRQLLNILTELEEYMKENEGMYILNAINRLQELKEKYK